MIGRTCRALVEDYCRWSVTMDNGQWTMEKADILQPVDQWTIDNGEG
ncbi:MAG: hypothetical protein FWF88_13345 [Peptococcaceae bacterium]|nr:hypothetical protein [Peptococcaceae bacterium]